MKVGPTKNFELYSINKGLIYCCIISLGLIGYQNIVITYFNRSKLREIHYITPQYTSVNTGILANPRVTLWGTEGLIRTYYCKLLLSYSSIFITFSLSEGFQNE